MDLVDDIEIDLGVKYSLKGCLVNCIECHGSDEELVPVSFYFCIGDTCLKMSFLDEKGLAYGSKIEQVKASCCETDRSDLCGKNSDHNTVDYNHTAHFFKQINNQKGVC